MCAAHMCTSNAAMHARMHARTHQPHTKSKHAHTRRMAAVSLSRGPPAQLMRHHGRARRCVRMRACVCVCACVRACVDLCFEFGVWFVASLESLIESWLPHSRGQNAPCQATPSHPNPPSATEQRAIRHMHPHRGMTQRQVAYTQLEQKKMSAAEIKHSGV